MEEKDIGCARPTGGRVGEPAPAEQPAVAEKVEKEVQPMPIMLGKKAPDFEAPAYYKGKFVSVKLSECLGKWVTLCFYPGDFTFV
jgi:peroxiredoxin (alkyl hydroperoxide reductase subunit C)